MQAALAQSAAYLPRATRAGEAAVGYVQHLAVQQHHKMRAATAGRLIPSESRPPRVQAATTAVPVTDDVRALKYAHCKS